MKTVFGIENDPCEQSLTTLFPAKNSLRDPNEPRDSALQRVSVFKISRYGILGLPSLGTYLSQRINPIPLARTLSLTVAGNT